MSGPRWEMTCPDGATIAFEDDGNPGCILLHIHAWEHETNAWADDVFVTIGLDAAVMFAAAMLSRLVEINPLDSQGA